MEHPLIEEKVASGAAADPGHGQHSRILAIELERIRKRDSLKVSEACLNRILAQAGIKIEDVAYIATTGEVDAFPLQTGYFFGMTTHSRGANFLCSEVRSVVDIGAMHSRAMTIDERSKVLKYRMTGQCASGSGQFLENISRYLGVTTDEIGELSMRSEAPEKVSGICAVLAETDVINMVSRGIATEDIVRGIHQSLADRLAKLFRSARCEFPLMLTGGLALDKGMVSTLEEEFMKRKLEPDIRTHEYSPHAGALGGALWGAFRHHKQGLRKSTQTAEKGMGVSA